MPAAPGPGRTNSSSRSSSSARSRTPRRTSPARLARPAKSRSSTDVSGTRCRSRTTRTPSSSSPCRTGRGTPARVLRSVGAGVGRPGGGQDRPVAHHDPHLRPLAAGAVGEDPGHPAGTSSAAWLPASVSENRRSTSYGEGWPPCTTRAATDSSCVCTDRSPGRPPRSRGPTGRPGEEVADERSAAQHDHDVRQRHEQRQPAQHEERPEHLGTDRRRSRASQVTSAVCAPRGQGEGPSRTPGGGGSRTIGRRHARAAPRALRPAPWHATRPAVCWSYATHRGGDDLRRTPHVRHHQHPPAPRRPRPPEAMGSRCSTAAGTARSPPSRRHRRLRRGESPIIGTVRLRQVDAAPRSPASTGPLSGTIHLGDTDITTLNDRALTLLRRDRIGFIFQSFNSCRPR